MHCPIRNAAGSLPALALIAAGTLGAAAQEEMTRATAKLTTADGMPAGNVEFTGGPNGVVVEVLAVGLAPGQHAIHLHETGSCAPDFSAAGGHYAPMGKSHGFLSPNGPHAGDLPNVTVSVDGAATAQFFNPRVRLDDGETGLFDEDGTAVIVHELADTHGATAEFGQAVACGVIEPLAE